MKFFKDNYGIIYRVLSETEYTITAVSQGCDISIFGKATKTRRCSISLHDLELNMSDSLWEKSFSADKQNPDLVPTFDDYISMETNKENELFEAELGILEPSW